jgi:hypothetical protein
MAYIAETIIQYQSYLIGFFAAVILFLLGMPIVRKQINVKGLPYGRAVFITHGWSIVILIVLLFSVQLVLDQGWLADIDFTEGMFSKTTATETEEARPTEEITITPSPQISVTNTAKSIPEAVSCTPWPEITTDQTGNEVCIYGEIMSAYTQGDAYFMLFENEPDSPFLLSYNIRPEGILNTCVQVTGELKQLGDAPVIVVNRLDEIQPCGENLPQISLP